MQGERFAVDRDLLRVGLAAAAGAALSACAAAWAFVPAHRPLALAVILAAAIVAGWAASLPFRRGALRAWLGSAGRHAVDAEKAARSAALVAETGAELSRSFHVESALPRVAGLTVPSFADWCTIHLTGREGLSLVAVAESGEPAATSASADSVSRAIAAGRPEPHASRIVVPLAFRGPAHGAIAFGMAQGKRVFGPADLSTAESIAHTIAFALENQKLHREAQEAGSRTDELLGNISHELRTPLNAIVGWATMLQTGKLDASMRQRAIETIDRNARAQARIIEDILDTSRLVAGKLRIDMQPVELAAVVTAALGAAQAEALAKEIHLRTTIDPAASVVAGDPIRLRQVMTNLLTHAIRATPKHGEIDVRVSRSNGHAEVVVRDSGAGIEAELLTRVFERFPLETVRRLVELHGGRIEAKSAGRGRGSTFRVTFPLSAAS